MYRERKYSTLSYCQVELNTIRIITYEFIINFITYSIIIATNLLSSYPLVYRFHILVLL